MSFVKILKNVIISNYIEDDIILATFNDIIEDNIHKFR